MLLLLLSLSSCGGASPPADEPERPAAVVAVPEASESPEPLSDSREVAPPSRGSEAGAPPCDDAGETNREQAREWFARARSAYAEGDYGTAVDGFRRSYRADCTAHPLLLNIATAYEKLGEPAEALRYLELYLDRMPTESPHDFVQKKIERLRKQLGR